MGHVSHVRVVRCELDLVGSLARDVVGHFYLAHGTALIDGEGGKGSLFILKVNVGRAVDGQKRSDVLGHVVDPHGALEQNAANLAKLFEHGAHFRLRDVVRQAAHVEVGLLQVARLLALRHGRDVHVARHEQLLLRLAAWERLVIHLEEQKGRRKVKGSVDHFLHEESK